MIPNNLLSYLKKFIGGLIKFMSKMFVVSHKFVDIKLPKNYYFFYVGANSKKLADENKFSFYDSYLEDNISIKNKNYCELTCLYAMAKDVRFKDENIGLCHYRRFFYNPLLSIFKIKKISVKHLDKILNNYDVIISYACVFKKTVYEEYIDNHIREDLDKTIEILLRLYPDYKKTVNSYFFENTKTCLFNMFYAKSELIAKYSDWLFSIFNELEKVIDLTNRDDYQTRVFGFLSERLFNVWVLQNKLKIKYLNVNQFEMSLLKGNLIAFRNYLKPKIYKLK